MDRRLSAIMAADVVGYSRLMGEDEAGTLAALKAHRAEFTDPTVAEHHGRIVKLMGDGVLIEFASVVDALECAVVLQRGMAERNADIPKDRRIEFRIGINLGDIIVDGDDIYGNGVNVAARLETLAEPGGICLSGRVLDQVEKNVDVGFTFLGPQTVKNIEKPVNAYKVLLDPEDAGKITNVAKPKPQTRRWLAAVMVVLLVAAGAGGLWYHQTRPEFEPAAVAKMAYPLPDKPSLAVLPFDNYSDDAKLGFFASGLTEDLTSSLSKEPSLFVISRNSAAAYKGEPVDVKRVAEEQGVQYVLEGSIQKAGNKLRVTAQLVDALNGRHLWAERFDRPEGDVFAVQDEIVKRVFVALQVELTEGDHARVASRGTDSLEAWLLRVEAYGELIKWTRESMVRARELYEAAHQADPNWVMPIAGPAWTHWYEAKRGWSASRDESIRLGMAAAERAIEVAPSEPIGYMALGNLYFLADQPERGIELRRKAMELAPNDFAAAVGLAMRIKDFGQEQEAVELFERAMRLSPKHPWYVSFGYGLALHLVGRKEEATATYKKAIGLSPKSAQIHARLAAVYADLGRMDEARGAAEEAVRLNPKLTASRYMKSYSLHDPGRDAWYKDLLLRAGLPDGETAIADGKPSIAVLPFTNMSGDPEQEYFTDGITEDVITDLSKISGLFVIARNTTFALKGTAVDVSAVAKDLGVRYVLEGSVRRAGERVRINAQLIDATTGGHLWAERYDGAIGDVFTLQDEVTEKIVAALAVKLTSDEKARRQRLETNSPEAYDAFLRGWEHYRKRTPEHFGKALGYFQKAVELDPNYAHAYAALAWIYSEAHHGGWWDALGLNPYAARARARELLEKAMTRPTPLAHQVASDMALWRGRYDEAMAEAGKAVALSPNDADSITTRAEVLIYAGHPEEALKDISLARRLDPNNEARHSLLEGMTRFGLEQYDLAIASLEKALELNPDLWSAQLLCAPCIPLVASYAYVGRMREAREMVKRFVTDGWAAMDTQSLLYYVPYKDAADSERLAEGLRQAGLPATPADVK